MEIIIEKDCIAVILRSDSSRSFPDLILVSSCVKAHVLYTCS